MKFKIIVLILSLLGVVGGGGLGVYWLRNLAGEAEKIKVWEQRESDSKSPQSRSARMRRQLDIMTYSAYGMIAGASVGLVAAVLLVAGKLHPLIAGVVLIGSSVAAGILETRGLVFSSPLLLAGGLCFLIKKPGRTAVTGLNQSVENLSPHP